MDHHLIAGQNSASSLEAETRFPGEDGGESLAKMAESDFDATLQLLAERAQYMTGANGAAIALRRGEHADMVCRASAGSNAPELGSLLSMEYGLSGESVRTRQALVCDDTEVDPRVNREGCRQLGIASVVVMPIVSERHVLGVFELFSGKPHAFGERDLSALQRLSEMVETAVRHAVAAQGMPEESAENAIGAVAEAVGPEKDALTLESEMTVLEETAPARAEPEPVPKKPIFWSAIMRTPQSGDGSGETAEPEVVPGAVTGPVPVPAELRNLQKCKACGFPVSQGRTLCVECEEKQWRGQRLP